MTTSRDPREKRDVFDIVTKEKNTSSRRHSLKDLLYGHNVLNLRPGFRLRHPWMWTLGFVAILALLFVGVRQLSTRADVHDFSPTTCLGNWQNVANAAGSPDTIAAPGTPFSVDNSAMYASGTEIYCGGFLPSSFATSGQIVNVGVTLVWQIGDAPTSTPSVSTSTATSTFDSAPTSTTVTSTAPSEPSTDAIPEMTPTSTSDQTPSTPLSTPETSEPASPSVAPTTPAVDTGTPPPGAGDDTSATSFIRRLIPFAFADDVPLVASDTASSTDVASSTASTTIFVAPVAAPDENFLDVSYSVDGQTWISIGKVNVNNWKQFTVTLPVSNWNDLQNLQIRVEGIPTTQEIIPPIYLDGMFVEVSYNAPSVIASLISPNNNGSTTASRASQVIQVSPNVTITTPPIEALPEVPAPTIVGIAKTDDAVAVTVQYVGDFYEGNPLYLFVYPAGTSANRNDGGSAFTFAGTPQEGPSINARSIGGNDLDPATKQGTVTIVAPSTSDGMTIATGEMASGTYDVDISYFDSQTWHLIPAQTFTW
jgi:hypothetical protein